MTRVPLLVRFPPKVEAGSRVEEAISTVGVYATVLELAGLPVPEGLHVGSLLNPLRGQPVEGPVMAEHFARLEGPPDTRTDPLLKQDVRRRSYRVGQKKLIQVSSPGSLKSYLFDLATDPGEEHDIAAEQPEEVARLIAELEAWQGGLGLPAIDAEVGGGAVPEVDPAARERLKSLGYLN